MVCCVPHRHTVELALTLSGVLCSLSGTLCTTQTHSRTGINTEHCAEFVAGSVNKWEDPFDSAVYCLQTDGQSAMLTGTARHGLVRLWDKRQQEHVQVSFCSTGEGPPGSRMHGSLAAARHTPVTQCLIFPQ